MAYPHDTTSERTSVLGPTLRFKGELSAAEDLLIHGQVEGTMAPPPGHDRRRSRRQGDGDGRGHRC